jgi:hypothetical protein
MTTTEFQRIEEYIRQGDLPRKDQKLDGLKRALIKKARLMLRDDTLLLDGIAIDPSELENGYWL